MSLLPVRHECQVGAIGTGECDCSDWRAHNPDAHCLKTYKNKREENSQHNSVYENVNSSNSQNFKDTFKHVFSF